jgi:hypothetical protein
MGETTCGRAVTSGMLGHTRYVSRCGKPVTEEGLCREHAADARYAREQFKRDMDRATRHYGRVAVHGKGTSCGCGAFVLDGQEHPWGLNAKDEEQWWADHPDDPHHPSRAKATKL